MDGESAIVWTTTGNLTNIRNNATFDFGVGMLPANVRPGAPSGGGNFYLFSGHSEEETRAAIDFVKWATAPEQAAQWSIATGYVAPRADTGETDAMREYAEEVPGALVARDQLEYAVAELATFQGPARDADPQPTTSLPRSSATKRQPRHWPMPRPRPTPSWPTTASQC